MTDRPKEVPDAWKYPIGPYRQAPPEYGGEWWMVNPFSGPEPWLRLDRKPPEEEVLPDGFVEIFGPRPRKEDYPIRTAWKREVVRWERDLENFVQAGVPPWASEKDLQSAAGVMTAWDMGAPSYYEHEDWGWMVRFTESPVPEFEMNAHTAVFYTHLVAAHYQLRLIQEGMPPARKHPLLFGVA